MNDSSNQQIGYTDNSTRYLRSGSLIISTHSPLGPTWGAIGYYHSFAPPDL